MAGEESSKTLPFRRCGCHQRDARKLEASSCGTRPLSFLGVRLCHSDLLPGQANTQVSRAQQRGAVRSSAASLLDRGCGTTYRLRHQTDGPSGI